MGSTGKRVNYILNNLSGDFLYINKSTVCFSTSTYRIFKSTTWTSNLMPKLTLTTLMLVNPLITAKSNVMCHIFVESDVMYLIFAKSNVFSKKTITGLLKLYAMFWVYKFLIFIIEKLKLLSTQHLIGFFYQSCSCNIHRVPTIVRCILDQLQIWPLEKYKFGLQVRQYHFPLNLIFGMRQTHLYFGYSVNSKLRNESWCLFVILTSK